MQEESILIIGLIRYQVTLMNELTRHAHATTYLPSNKEGDTSKNKILLANNENVR